MDAARAGLVLAELRRRARQTTLLDDAFPAQRAFLDDPSPLKAALCTRRAGKSMGVGMYLVDAALRWPGTSQLYAALTRDSARRIMIKDVLKPLNRRYGLAAKFIERPLEMRFKNGSAIYLLGADADEDERDKILGQKFKRVAVDECASFRTNLEELVVKVIRPATIDLSGEIALIGTPGNVKNWFFDVTTGKVPEWSVHRWTAAQNPHVAKQWEAELARMIAANPHVVETPWFQQMHEGRWVVDTTNLVYSGYSATRNDLWADGLEGALSEWVFILGIDLGYNDATSLTLGAYKRRGDGTLYILKSVKRTGLIVSAVAEWIRKYKARYPISAYVVDPASKQVVEELIQRYKLPLEAADKDGKAEAIAMMNSDLILGKVRVLQPHCSALTDEWGGLIWDPRALEKRRRREEHPGCENHCADSALYMWRRATNYQARPEKGAPPAPGTLAYEQEREEREDEDDAKEENEWLEN